MKENAPACSPVLPSGGSFVLPAKPRGCLLLFVEKRCWSEETFNGRYD